MILAHADIGARINAGAALANDDISADHFLTTEQFLPVHRDQLSETERLIAEATAQGSQRKLEMNENVKLNLVRIIEGLESIKDKDPAAEEAANVA